MDFYHMFFIVLEALPVDNVGTGLLELLLGDPHLLEGGEGRKDGPSNPDGVLALRRGDDLDLHRAGHEGVELLGHTLADALVHGGAAGEDDVGVQVLADVHVTAGNRVEGGGMDAGGLLTDEGRLEEDLGAPETLVADGDDVAVGQLVGLFNLAGRSRGVHFLLEVQGNVAELLLDVTDNFLFGSRREGETALGQNLLHELREVAAGKVETHDGVRQGVTLVDGDGVGDTVAGVEHDTGRTTGGVQRQHGLDGHVHGGHVVGLEHDGGHLLTVGLGVHRGLGQENGVLLGCNAQLVVEGVVPDLLHVLPVGHDTVLNRVLQSQNTTLGLRLVPDVGVLLVHTHHERRVFRATHDAGEDATGSVIAGDTGLDVAGAVVDDQSGGLFVRHFVKLIFLRRSERCPGIHEHAHGGNDTYCAH
ncbi:fumarate reductase [Babesia caballi]|uniref:Fumarate reductase n=1 Tax=Babesia caballi TaxID=5871 RepID=A0AAV4LRT1_BABCB|nr:fumarate reductase [Babesia caballi]